MCSSFTIPDFDELPPVPGMPQGCAWGIFDRNGQKDTLGTLNLLTPEVVKKAAAEIKEGISVSLNWPIGSLKPDGFFRKALVRRVISLDNGTPESRFGFDDELEFNTQCSSQWDSLCHFQHLPTGLAYNGARPTIDALNGTSGESKHELPTLHRWHDRGCLAGRGVLIDYRAYADANGIEYSPFSAFRIGISDIVDVAQYQGVTFRPGDILIIRFGFTEALETMTPEQQTQALSSGAICGVEGTVEMARWLWNQHFSAVASDTMAFEAMPPMANGEARPFVELVLHRWCLSLFGLPLGELWALKALSEQCSKSQRYTFFLTSSPLNVPGLVGSPPNVLAIL